MLCGGFWEVGIREGSKTPPNWKSPQEHGSDPRAAFLPRRPANIIRYIDTTGDLRIVPTVFTALSAVCRVKNFISALKSLKKGYLSAFSPKGVEFYAFSCYNGICRIKLKGEQICPA